MTYSLLSWLKASIRPAPQPISSPIVTVVTRGWEYFIIFATRFTWKGQSGHLRQKIPKNGSQRSEYRSQETTSRGISRK